MFSVLGYADAVVSEFGRQAELDMFLLAVHLRDFDRLNPPKRGDDILDQTLRRRSTGGKADDTLAANPLRIQFAAVGDQIARNAFFATDLTQAIGIRTVLGADDEDDVRYLGQFSHRGLAILRRIADVFGVGSDNRGKPFL